MEMYPVASTDLSAVGYDYDACILRIEFLKGGIYDYHGVPQEVYEGLMNASSKGQFFNQVIRKGGYSFSKS